jgi:DNA-directed RNA polymerase
VYSVPQVVHPQADDMGRALLQFARGKPIGEKEAEWLAVYVANLAGRDKLPLKERSGWVRHNQEEIVAWARRPLEGGRFWKEADKPWRFLAAAQDWAGYVKHGPGYVSHLPVAMDGTCNCLQHLSALGRDPVGGRSTNVVPLPNRRDIYGEVADELRKPVALDADRGHEIAKLALDLINRKLVKQATMTTPYGVTEKGLRDQLVAAIGENWPDRFPDDYEAAAYLANYLDQAISRVVVKGAEIRGWLRGVVELLAGKGLGLSWIVPTGFPVVHHYLVEAKKRVRTLVGTQLIREQADEAQVNAVKQANAIVANLVHSLDAAHMMFTVCALKALGISDLAMVHDSYAVHAADVEVMNRVLREQFIRVHTEFTLATFVEQIRKQAPGVAIPDPPVPGGLDLADVMRSEYFFS